MFLFLSNFSALISLVWRLLSLVIGWGYLPARWLLRFNDSQSIYHWYGNLEFRNGRHKTPCVANPNIIPSKLTRDSSQQAVTGQNSKFMPDNSGGITGLRLPNTLVCACWELDFLPPEYYSRFLKGYPLLSSSRTYNTGGQTVGEIPFLQLLPPLQAVSAMMSSYGVYALPHFQSPRLGVGSVSVSASLHKKPLCVISMGRVGGFENFE